jgi:hypothetical protein
VLAPSSLLLVQAIFDGENNEETKFMGKRIDAMSIAPIAARFFPRRSTNRVVRVSGGSFVIKPV